MYMPSVCISGHFILVYTPTITECSKHGEVHMQTASVKGGVSASMVGRHTIRMRVLSLYHFSCNARHAVSPHHDDSATSCSCQLEAHDADADELETTFESSGCPADNWPLLSWFL